MKAIIKFKYGEHLTNDEIIKFEGGPSISQIIEFNGTYVDLIHKTHDTLTNCFYNLPNELDSIKLGILGEELMEWTDTTNDIIDKYGGVDFCSFDEYEFTEEQAKEFLEWRNGYNGFLYNIVES